MLLCSIVMLVHLTQSSWPVVHGHGWTCTSLTIGILSIHGMNLHTYVMYVKLTFNEVSLNNEGSVT